MRNIPSNPILDRLPAHLHQYIIPQDYDSYTHENQAVWRYVMRKNISFLSKVAHHAYIEGLRATGVSMDQIPDMYGMNRILQDIGWAAAAVDGFIPPAAFMEFQAYNVLVIAADIRQLENIEYTPAPDIIHEAAGHAPIIANPEYAEYLRRLGEIGSKAISSHYDWELYEAVRKLSQLKEVEGIPQNEIDKAQAKVDELQSQEQEQSEMAKIRNLQWWSVEYGLIGNLEEYKIYGAGLLSSIGESEWCLSEQVVKLPYTIETANQGFDITRPQPHLFVTPDFAHLSQILDEFANTMSLRKGGLEGVKKLIDSQNIGTIELSTGLQISGFFDEVVEADGKVVFVGLKGEAALSYREKELIGHSRLHYKDGFCSPLGKLKGINLAIEDMSPKDLEAYAIYEGRLVSLEFEGEVKVEGIVVTGTRNLKGKILLISFKECKVMHQDRILFDSNHNLFHLAVGKKIVSAFAGPADLKSFDLKDHELSVKVIVEENHEEQSYLESLYFRIKKGRSEVLADDDLNKLVEEVEHEFSDEWLLNLELYELLNLKGRKEAKIVLSRLEMLKESNPKLKNLIESGLEMIKHSDFS